VLLTPGTRIGSYEIAAPIGVGGMGEVYCATDTKLKRPVAIKVLPASVTGDANRLARFQREAEVLASLNHPNIAHVYGLEQSDGVQAIVMELVEGPTLADRIASGPISVDEALPIAKQIAEALEAAHEQGIIHRDLKPANVKVRPDGTVKVLDFGLAKALEPAGAASGVSQSPTITTPAMTQAGIILGTAAYMSPEQARGKAVDKRSDIWAFGCVLFEMLTGARVFQQDEVSDTLALVLTKDPDWSALPADTPPAIRRLLRRCLVKDRRARLPDIGSARLDIDEARTDQVATPLEADFPSSWVNSRLRRSLLVVGAIAIVALAAVAAWRAVRAQPTDLLLTRTLIGVAPAERLMTAIRFDVSMGQGRPSRTTMAFAPDGRSLVFSAERNGRVQLYVRRLDALEATPIAGTEGASNPFLSPTGDAVAFYADRALKKVSLAGGAAVTLCNVDLVYGATWGSTDQIVFANQAGGLWRIAASGGMPTPVTKPQPGEYSHRLPQFLPDGQTVVFTVTTQGFPRWDDTRIVAQSLISGERKVLIDGGADARYVSTGHLIYLRRGTLMALSFDTHRLEATGTPVGILANVMQAANIQPLMIDSGAGQFAVSESGSLAYVTGGVFPQERWSLVWVDRSGKSEPLNVPPGAYLAPRVSPDGKRVAFGNAAGDWDLSIYDVSRGLIARLEMEEQQSVPVWTPDSSRIVFTSGLTVARKLFSRNADGRGAPEALPLPGPGPKLLPPFANSWTPDGTSLVVWLDGSLWLLPRGEKGELRPLLADRTPALEAEFSPDGRWLAYTSGGPDRFQVYVRPYPALDRQVQVAGENSRAPLWRGRELFYLEDAIAEGLVRVVAVPVTTAPTFSLGLPRVLFEGPFRTDGPFRGYDVTPDGQRFLMVRAIEHPPERVSQMVFIQNWFEELKRLVPTK
jgi:eukaryotic-like serine/threonine-protein kinase